MTTSRDSRGLHQKSYPTKEATEEAARALTALLRQVIPTFPALSVSEGAVNSGRFYVRLQGLFADEVQDLLDDAAMAKLIAES